MSTGIAPCRPGRGPCRGTPPVREGGAPVPGYPRRVQGRHAVAELYRLYDNAIVVATGFSYANRYISVLTITDRKVSRWHDYLDPIAVFDWLGWPSGKSGA